MHFISNKPHSTRFSPGFALIATISVMILLVMIALAMLSLSTLEQRNARQSSAQAEARANARVALMLAIGQLQMSAGQDQRITSAAGFLDTAKSAHDTISGVENPLWTGVWASDNEREPSSYENRKAAKFQQWLVSIRDNSAAEQLDTARTPIDHSVVLVGDGTLGNLTTNQQNHTVKAQKIHSYDDRMALAWWVGDESVKARLNIPAINNPNGDRAWQQALNQSAPSAGTGMTEALPWLDASTAQSQATLQKILSSSTFKLHPDSVDQEPSNFHDFSLSSVSLPTNVRDGGYKWDLSRLFAHEELPDAFTNGERSLTEKKTGKEFKKDIGLPLYDAPQGNNTIPGWQRLADYHRLYKLVKWDGNKPYILYDKENWMKLRSLSCSAPLPIITRMQVFYSLTIGQNNRLSLVIEPVVTFWNPYNVELRVPEDEGEIVMRSTWQSIRIEILRNGGRINGTSYTRNLFYPQWPHTNMRFIMRGFTLEPGETKVCSDRSNRPYDWNAARTTWGENIYAQPGWENKGGLMGDGYGNFGVVAPGQTLSARIEPWASFHNDGDDWGIRGSNMWHQMDLIRREPGLWSHDTFKSLQIFRVKDHSASEMAKLWDFNSFTRNGISTSQLLGGNKIPLCVTDVAVRTEQDGPFETLPYLFTSSSSGSFLSNKQHNPVDLASTYWTTRVRKVSDWDDRTVEIEPNTNRGFFGSGNTADTGVNFVTMREIPTRPPLSLAAYRNFDLLFSPEVFKHWGSSSKIDPAYHAASPSTNYAISGGYAHPMLPRNKINASHTDPNVLGSVYDHAYLANWSLYDKWFHSGIPTGESDNTVEQGSLTSILNGDEYLPNPRLQWQRGLDQTKVEGLIIDPEKGHEHVAPYMYVSGGFNVNSTSVEAWRAFLGSMQKRKIPRYGQPDEQGYGASFPRQTIVKGEDINANPGDQENLWNGYQSLDEDDVEKLAKSIVEQVKVRGPFFSMADFVNRRLSSTGEDSIATTGASKNFDLSRSSALQAAIDNTDLNERNFSVSLSSQDVAGIGFNNADAVDGLRAAGAPGYLMQGDLLQALGSSMTVRGDTFTVRAYGESRTTAGVVRARAWCEAVVQRDHEYVDPRDDHKETQNLQKVNEDFGRRFKIVRFRWLNENEV